MKRLIVLILVVVAYGAGYFTQSILESNQWSSLARSTPKSVLGTSNTNTGQQDEFVTKVNFDGTRFSPSSVTIKKSYIIAITNMSKTEGMWLQSDNSLLNTTRSYGESEQLRAELLTPGTYHVINKLKSGGVLTVSVVGN